jgi:rubrerythrin
MDDETDNEGKSDLAETRTRNVTFWRCTNCGGLNKSEGQPEICELCGEGKTFEKMKLKIKTSSEHDT